MMLNCVPCNRDGVERKAIWRVWPDAGPGGTGYTFMCTQHCVKALVEGMDESMLNTPVKEPVRVAKVSLIVGNG